MSNRQLAAKIVDESVDFLKARGLDSWSEQIDRETWDELLVSWIDNVESLLNERLGPTIECGLDAKRMVPGVGTTGERV